MENVTFGELQRPEDGTEKVFFFFCFICLPCINHAQTAATAALQKCDSRGRSVDKIDRAWWRAAARKKI